MKRNLNDLKSKLNEELKLQNSSQKRIEELRSQISKEKENKKLKKVPKDIEKRFKEALRQTETEMNKLLSQLRDKEKEVCNAQALVSSEAEKLSEKYGIPINYCSMDEEFWYKPESYSDKWEEYEFVLKDNFEHEIKHFGWLSEGWRSSRC